MEKQRLSGSEGPGYKTNNNKTKQNKTKTKQTKNNKRGGGE